MPPPHSRSRIAALARTAALLAAVLLCLARCCRTRSPHPSRKDPILWTGKTTTYTATSGVDSVTSEPAAD